MVVALTGEVTGDPELAAGDVFQVQVVFADDTEVDGTPGPA